MSHYFRVHLQPTMSTPLARESHHLAAIIDLALRGRVAAALDFAGQRLEALESMARGTQTEVACRLELIGPEKPSLVPVQEASAAGKDLQVEERVMKRNANRTWWGDRDFAKGKGKEKGKREKGKGDGKHKGGRKGEGKKKGEKDESSDPAS